MVSFGNILKDVADEWKSLVGKIDDVPTPGNLANTASQAARSATPFVSKAMQIVAPDNLASGNMFGAPQNLVQNSLQLDNIARGMAGAPANLARNMIGAPQNLARGMAGMPQNLTRGMGGGPQSLLGNISGVGGPKALGLGWGEGPVNILREGFQFGPPKAPTGGDTGEGGPFTGDAGFGNLGSAAGGDPAGARGLDGTRQWQSMIEKAAKEAGIPWQVISAIMGIESGGRPDTTSVAGAAGLMQIMSHYEDGTPLWQSVIDKFGGDKYDPWTNIRAGAEILKTFYDQYGDWGTAANAYLGFGPADAYGTTGEMYVNLFRNNIAALGWDKPANTPTTGGSEVANKAIDFAKAAIGTPYHWGGESYEEGGFDCSGLVHAMYQAAGVNLPRDTAQGYANSTTRVGRDELQPGDLIFYSFGGSEVDHVAIYIGNGQMIQASSDGGDTHIRSANEDWYVQHETGYGRI